MWVVCHEWPSGTQFNFNCYLHWATLVIRGGGGGRGGGSLNINHIGGNPVGGLYMITHGLRVLLLIQEI